MVDDGNCAVCKNDRGESNHKISTSKICESCYKEDYVGCVGAGKILEMNGPTVCKYYRMKNHDIVPSPDAMKCTISPLWKKTSLVSFKEALPKFDLTKVEILTELDMRRWEIAKELGGDVFYLNRFCNENGIASVFGNKTSEVKDRNFYQTQSYNKASKLLNKCITNTLT